MITLTIKIAASGTIIDGNGNSGTGHMWLSLDSDGATGPLPAVSLGYGPDTRDGAPLLQGRVYDNDDETYASTYYTGTIGISDAQYSQLIAFGKNPSNYGFSTTFYTAWNSCIDFVWKALEVAGLNSSGFTGDFWPTWNADDIDRTLYTYLFKEFSGWQADWSAQSGFDVIYGSMTGDNLQAQIWTDAIYGGEGDDTITGNSFSNYLEGNDGDDKLEGDAGADTLLGGNGNDILYGDDGNDMIDGEAGDDVIYGDLGNDTLAGGDGNDMLVGGGDDDILYGDDSNDTIDGGDGDDVIYGGFGSDILLGGIGNDILQGDDGAGGDILEGGNGNDTYYADNGDTIRDSDGQGTIYINGKQLTFATRNKGETTWTDAAGNTYTLSGGNLQINDPLTIEGFSNGQLGIYLDDKEDPGSPLPKPTYNPNASAIIRRVDPLVLDLDGNGQIDTVASTTSTTYFDFNGDGIAEKSGWVAAQDGILALDANNNGVIDNLSELFGSASQDGFTELVGLDSHQDGTIDSQDTDYSQLRVWQDSNQDGIAQSVELHTLADLNITAINLAATPDNIPTADNLITATGSFIRNGQTQLAADIHLSVNFAQTDSNPNRPLDQAPTLSADVFELPWLRGYGLVKSLHVAYQENPSLKQAATDLIVQGRDGILVNFDGFLAQWTGLATAHAVHGVTRTTLTIEDKVWMLETFTGQDVHKTAIEAANFGAISPGSRQIWDSTYIEKQYQSFAKREAISFTIQAIEKDWIKGAYYSLAGDRFVVADTAMLQDSLIQGLSVISNQQDAIFAAVTLERLRSDGCDLQAVTLKPALAAFLYAQMYAAAIDGRFVLRTVAGTFIVPDAQSWCVVGSDGNDLLYGNGGNDLLVGGDGNDTLQGGAGNDTYLFNSGDGQDTISDGDSTAGNLDTVRFGAGIVAGDITFSRNGNDLVLGINGTTDQLKIHSWGYGDYYHIERAEFADGTVWNAVYLQAQASAMPIVGTTGNDYLLGDAGNNTLDGRAGNDILQSGTGNDIYLFNLGGGQDTISDVDSTAGNVDTVRFGAGIAASGITFSRSGYDLVLGINGTTDQIMIQNWGYGDSYRIERVEFADGTSWTAAYLLAQASATPIVGTTGNDYLFGDAGNNILDGGAGNDTLLGGKGNDTYLFNLGGGQDTIFDDYSTPGNVDTVRFGAGIAASGITLSRSGNDLVLDINCTTDQLTIQNWGYGDNFHIERVEFAGGTIWDVAYLQAQISVLPIVGTAGNDTLVGDAGNNTLDGGAGNDTLHGGTGNDTYLFNLGGGQDTISDGDYTLGNVDTVRFGAGIAAGDITFIRSGMDLVLSINGTADQLKIPTWGSGDYYHIERVEFADGTVWNAAYLQAKVLSVFAVGTEGNDYLQSWLGDNASLQGMGGNDTLTGNNGNDTLDGGTGNDTLQGGLGNDTYLFNLGGGQDMISDSDSTAGNMDTVRFGVGIAAGDIMFSRNDNNLVLSINGTTDQLTIQNWKYGDPYYLERVEFADGTSWNAAYLQAQISAIPIVGTNGNDDLRNWSEANEILQGMGGNDDLIGNRGNDTLEGGNGNDYLRGEMGNDTYLFNLGDGQDTIYDYSGNQDTIRFGAGIAASGITFSRSDNDLVLSINGTSDQIKIQNWWVGNDFRIECVEFADGSAWDAAQIQALIPAPPIIGADGNDSLNALLGENAMLQGLGGNDSLFGNNGNDTLDGGIGNDYLNGGLGNDVYVFGLGSGQDTISDYNYTSDNEDTVRFGDGIAASDITILNTHGGGYGGDLVLGINGTTDQVTLQNWGFGNDYYIERLEFADGTSWDAAYLQARISAIPIVGTAGNDYLSGDAGNNTLDGGAGNDTLEGRAGNDTYLFNLGGGQDTISDVDFTVGNVDTVRFGAGIAAGDITFSRSGYDLVLNINGTSDQLKIQNWLNGSAYRIERVEFADGMVWNAAQLQAFVPAILISGTEQTDYLYALMGENSRLLGLGGNDILYGNDGNDILEGGAGNDGLTGRLGNDVYVFGLGGGQDFSYDGDSTVGNMDTLRFGAGIRADDITFSRSGNNLVLGINGTTDQWTIYNWSSDIASRIERVEFADGKVWDTAQLQSFVPSNLISGTAADDFLQGGIGNDTYLFNPGGGQDTISDSDSVEGNIDTIRFGTGIAAGDITFSRSGNDLVLSINGTTDQLKIQNWRDGDSCYIERVEFADGTSWDTTQLQAFASAAPISGTEAADSLQALAGENTTLQGLGGDDSLYGNDGNDILDGGIGNDYLNGGIGDDIYRFNLGDGQDTVIDEQGSDTLYIGGNLTAADLGGLRDGDDMIVNVLGTADFITLTNWFVQSEGVNRINFGDGSSLDRSGMEDLLNSPPVAHPDAITVFEDGGAMNVPTAALLANDTDPNANDVISVVAVGASAIGASVLLVNGQVQYDIGTRYQELGAEQTLTDSFDYTVSDSMGATSGSEVSVTITGINDAPVTVADTVVVQEDLILTAMGNVLADDTDVDQGDVLSIADVGVFSGSYGRLTLAEDGSYIYALDNTLLAVQSLAAGQTVSDTFDYQVTDGLSATSSILTVTITGTNDAPVIAIPPTGQTATESSTFSYRLPINAFTDIDTGDRLSYSSELTNGNPLPDWLTFNAGTGTFNSVLPNGSAGLWDINVTATDASGAGSSSTFRLDVANLIKGAGKADTLDGTDLRDLIYGLAGNDRLRGAAAADVLVGGSGNDMLEGASGDDILVGGIPRGAVFAGALIPVESGKNKSDNNLLYSDSGNDTLIGGGRNDLLIGGTGNDTFYTGTGADIIAFNRGDGQDTVLANLSTELLILSSAEEAKKSGGNRMPADDTLSLGGGIKMSDLYFRHLGNDLILETGLSVNSGQAQDRITLQDWYASPNNHSIDTLQMIDTTGNKARNAHNTQIDFGKLVELFDKAVAANATIDHWALTNAKLDKYPEHAKGEALGGDLAYLYGKNGSLVAVSLNAAQDMLDNFSFGIHPQDLHNLSGWIV